VLGPGVSGDQVGGRLRADVGHGRMRAWTPHAPAASASAGPPAMTPEQVGHARAMLAQPKASIASIARLLGVSRSTLYKYVPELKPGSQPAALPGSTAAQGGTPE
jgi:DNA invertase Pin-like site-specific DNA recombinase